MKRFITIFFTIVLSVGLWGQSVPMTIVGDVYVSSNGKMLSKGSVHLQALSSQRQARVDNNGEMKVDSAIIFYSNDSIDGLLRNLGTITVTHDTVIVRKTFPIVKNGGYGYNYQISLPFDVKVSNGIVVLDPTMGPTMKAGNYNPITLGNFYLQVYDAQKRANRGINDDYNWVPNLPGNVLSTGVGVMDTVQILRKGLGYRFMLDTDYPDNTTVDFIAMTPGDVTQLFSNVQKTHPLVWYPHTYNPSNYPLSRQLVDSTVAISEGWNAFGGLNSTYFQFNSTPATYSLNGNTTGTVYYWDGVSGMYKELTSLPVGQVGTLRPYGVIWAQTNAVGGGSFTFNSGGLRLTNSGAPTLFRSSQTYADDILGLRLINTTNEADSSIIYFRFGQYSKDFKKTEDDFRLETSNKVHPIVWSVGKVAGNDSGGTYNLFVNSLPFGENEIPLGVNIPKAGSYAFSLREFFNGSVSSAVLKNGLTGEQKDLLKEDFYVDFNAAYNGTERFVLYINRSITSITPSSEKTIYAFTDNNLLTVKNLSQGDAVQVLDVAGRVMASGVATGDSFTATLNQKGVYIVNVKGIKTLKVLNK